MAGYFSLNSPSSIGRTYSAMVVLAPMIKIPLTSPVSSRTLVFHLAVERDDLVGVLEHTLAGGGEADLVVRAVRTAAC